MEEALIPRREFNQFGFYGARVIINHTRTLNDAPGLRTVEVSRRHIACPPHQTTTRRALVVDKFVGFKTTRGRSHLFHPNDIDLGRPPLLRLVAEESSFVLVGPFLTHRQLELKILSLVAFSN